MESKYSYEQLKSVRKLITHDECHDGIASAITVKAALPDVEVVPVAYGTRHYEELPVEDGLLFCDMSPPASRVQEFVAAGSLIMDHHTSAKPAVEVMGGVYADEKVDIGVSGAMLAYKYVYTPIAAKETKYRYAAGLQKLAEFVGIYDLWVRDSPNWVRAMDLCATLRFYGLNHWLRMDPAKACEWLWSRLDVGAAVNFRKLYRANKVLLGKGYEVLTGTKTGMHVAVFPETVPDKIAGMVMDNAPADIDLVFAYNYSVEGGRPSLDVSVRSRGGKFDCGEFAKYFGGGGHLNAAGFTTALGAGTASPVTILQSLLDAYPLA